MLKANATDYYHKYLQTYNAKGAIVNDLVNREEIGDVIFARQGLKKMTHDTHYEKLKTLPFVKDIIKKGEISGPLKDEKHEFIENWYYITGDVEIDGIPFKMQVDIAEDMNGNKFYISNDITGRNKKEFDVGQPKRAASSNSNNTIAQKEKDVKGKDEAGIPSSEEKKPQKNKAVLGKKEDKPKGEAMKEFFKKLKALLSKKTR
ncbi:MAG: hypothetical protein LBO62_06415 [Endomicrobium sp.]|jgi:hypothetical protein|nr:hypothetical protein [Endomicrobium sp.]